MTDRYTRYTPLLSVTCAGQSDRYNRYTPLEGCNGCNAGEDEDLIEGGQI